MSGAMDTPEGTPRQKPGGRAIEAAWSAIQQQERAEAEEAAALEKVLKPQRELIEMAAKHQMRSSALLAAATVWAPSLRGAVIHEDRVLETADAFLAWLDKDRPTFAQEVAQAEAEGRRGPLSGGQDSPTNVGRAPAAQGEEDPTSSVPLEVAPDTSWVKTTEIKDVLKEGDYVQDGKGLVWKVIRDGGMLERPNHAETCPQAVYPGSRYNEDACNCPGVTTAGIAWLRATAGPLVKLR